MFIRKLLIKKYKEIINSLEDENESLRAKNYELQLKLEKKPTTRKKAK